MGKIIKKIIEVEEIAQHINSDGNSLDIHYCIVNTSKGFIDRFRLAERILGEIRSGEKKVTTYKEKVAKILLKDNLESK